MGKRVAAVLAASAMVAVSAGGFSSTAVAAAGNPGVPGEPEVLLSEGFENALDNGELVTLEAYAGTGGKSYTADPAWLDADQCNGILIDNQTSDADLNAVGCDDAGARDVLRNLASALGEFNGSADPTENHIVAAYTLAADPGANGVEFRTENPIALAANGRFLSVSLNVGVGNCHAAHPAFNFFLGDNGEETQINDATLDPCQSNEQEPVYTVAVTPDNAALFTSNQVDIIIRNAQASGNGNDHAFDDVKVLDVTPQLDKEFRSDAEDLRPGDVVDMVFTVTNTSELATKSGWEFTDQLPEGLEVTGEGTTDCGGTLTGTAGDTSVGIADGVLANGQVSCEISWPVTSTKAGDFVNLASDVDAAGLNPPADAPVSFIEDTPAAPEVPAVPETGVAPAPSTLPTLALAGGLLLVLGAGAGLVLNRRRG